MDVLVSQLVVLGIVVDLVPRSFHHSDVVWSVLVVQVSVGILVSLMDIRRKADRGICWADTAVVFSLDSLMRCAPAGCRNSIHGFP